MGVAVVLAMGLAVVRGMKVTLATRDHAGSFGRMGDPARSARRLAFDVLGDWQPGQGGLDAGPGFGDPLLEVCTCGDRVVQAALQRAVLFRQAAGDFDQARYALTQHLDVVVHVAGW
jgi:hypothetical protein